jgi:biopolymer transport protein ExbD
MASKDRRKEHRDDPLDLVPIMNLVTILIPFLLMSAQFVHLAVIDSTLPAIGPPQETVEEDDEPPLMLSIAITDQGYTVLGDNGVVTGEEAEGEEAAALVEGEMAEPTVPCRERPCAGPESYDTEQLTRLLSLIKDEYPDDENVILVPESRIHYEVIVVTMDATRADPGTTGPDGKERELFPFVVIAGGAQ